MKGALTTTLALLASGITAAILPLSNRDESISSNSTTLFNGTCTAETLTVRTEWRNLNDTEKKAFIDAELCLMSVDTAVAQTGLPGVTDRFSDLQAVHQYMTNTSDGDIIHWVVSCYFSCEAHCCVPQLGIDGWRLTRPKGQFLPWHRLLMYTHEVLLRTECNYTGSLP